MRTRLVPRAVRRLLLALLAPLVVVSAARAQGPLSPLGGPPGGRVGGVVPHPLGSVALVQDGRLFCSLHDGEAWETPALLHGQQIGRFGREGDALVASASERRYLSTDGCRTWRDVTGQDTRAERAVRGAAGWFVRDDSSRVLRSTDRGASWHPTGAWSLSAPQATGNGDVFVLTRDASGLPDRQLARWSADSAKWTPVRAFYFRPDVLTGPGDALAVEEGTHSGVSLSVSEDAGRSWQFVTDGEGLAMAFAPDGALLVAANGSLWRRAPGGASATSFPNPRGLTRVAALRSGALLGWHGVSGAGGLYRLRASGAWTPAMPEEATTWKRRPPPRA